jgi:type I restriction enzyme S subunit
MEVKKGYKQTDVGIIPEDWEIISARDACSKIQDGTHFSPKNSGNEFLYVTSKNIRFGYLDLSTASWIDKAQHEAIYKRCDVKKGDLLLTKDGANTGNAALNNIDEEFSLLSSVAFLRFNPSKYCAAYFLQQVLSSQGQNQIKEAMSGNAITRLTLEKINKLKFTVPPTLAEQEAIAEALSDADALIEAIEQLLAKKRQVKQGAMQELLTGKRRLPEFSKQWETKKLGDIFEITAGGDFDPTQSSDIRDERFPYPIYSNALTDKGLYGFSSYNNHQAGSITVTARGTLGNANYRDHDFTAIGRVIVLKPTQPLDGRFISEFINNRIDFVIESTGVPQLTAPQISKYEILFPEFPEQTAIAEILSDMDAEIAALEEKLSKARQVKQGMMSELLTGKIRLV